MHMKRSLFIQQPQELPRWQRKKQLTERQPGQINYVVRHRKSGFFTMIVDWLHTKRGYVKAMT